MLRCITNFGNGALVTSTAKHAAALGVDLDRDIGADLETLKRMGLHPQHLAGRQRRVIFADIAEEDVIGDLRHFSGGRTGGRGEVNIFGTDRDVDALARRDAVERGDVDGEIRRKLDRAAVLGS